MIVRRNPPESQAGRFVLATNERPNVGTVVAVGPGALTKDGRRIPTGISVGDVVYWDQHSGQELDEGGAHYLVLTPQNIIGIADPEATVAARAFQEAVGRLVAEERAVFAEDQRTTEHLRGEQWTPAQMAKARAA